VDASNRSTNQSHQGSARIWLCSVGRRTAYILNTLSARGTNSAVQWAVAVGFGVECPQPCSVESFCPPVGRHHVAVAAKYCVKVGGFSAPRLWTGVSISQCGRRSPSKSCLTSYKPSFPTVRRPASCRSPGSTVTRHSLVKDAVGGAVATYRCEILAPMGLWNPIQVSPNVRRFV